jgi:hypothetical protein
MPANRVVATSSLCQASRCIRQAPRDTAAGPGSSARAISPGALERHVGHVCVGLPVLAPSDSHCTEHRYCCG